MATVNKFKLAQERIRTKIRMSEHGSIRFSSLSRKEQKIADYMINHGMLQATPIKGDWILS